MPAVSIQFSLKNGGSTSVTLLHSHLDHGQWTDPWQPENKAQTIAPGNTGFWRAECDDERIFGCYGSVTFVTDAVSQTEQGPAEHSEFIKIFWAIPYVIPIVNIGGNFPPGFVPVTFEIRRHDPDGQTDPFDKTPDTATIVQLVKLGSGSTEDWDQQLLSDSVELTLLAPVSWFTTVSSENGNHWSIDLEIENNSSIESPLPVASLTLTRPADLLLFKNKTGQAFTSRWQSGVNLTPVKQIGKWDTDWSCLASFRVAFDQFLLMYKNSTGAAYAAPVLLGAQPGETTISTPVRIGEWDKNWTTLAPFVFGGNTFLFFYKAATGQAFVAPIVSGVLVGKLTQIGSWDRDWSIIAPFAVAGAPYLLLYKRSSGQVFSAPFLSPTHLAVIKQIGVWDKDWATLAPFAVGGQSFLLLYKQSTGLTFSAPFEPGGTVGALTQIGLWDKDWTLIGPFSAA